MNNKLTSNLNTIFFYGKKNFFHFYSLQLHFYLWLHGYSEKSRECMLNNKAEKKLASCIEENGKKMGGKLWNATCVYKNRI